MFGSEAIRPFILFVVLAVPALSATDAIAQCLNCRTHFSAPRPSRTPASFSPRYYPVQGGAFALHNGNCFETRNGQRIVGACVKDRVWQTNQFGQWFQRDVYYMLRVRRSDGWLFIDRSATGLQSEELPPAMRDQLVGMYKKKYYDDYDKRALKPNLPEQTSWALGQIHTKYYPQLAVAPSPTPAQTPTPTPAQTPTPTPTSTPAQNPTPVDPRPASTERTAEQAAPPEKKHEGAGVEDKDKKRSEAPPQAQTPKAETDEEGEKRCNDLAAEIVKIQAKEVPKEEQSLITPPHKRLPKFSGISLCTDPGEGYGCYRVIDGLEKDQFGKTVRTRREYPVPAAMSIRVTDNAIYFDRKKETEEGQPPAYLRQRLDLTGASLDLKAVKACFDNKTVKARLFVESVSADQSHESEAHIDVTVLEMKPADLTMGWVTAVEQKK